MLVIHISNSSKHILIYFHFQAGSVGEVLREHYRRGKIIGAICAGIVVFT